MTFEQLKTKIADSAAISDIECYCMRQMLDGDWWYDTIDIDPGEREYVDDAVAYLTARGLLDTWYCNDHLVKLHTDNSPDEPDPPQRMDDGIEAPTMMQIARENGLSVHLYMGQRPMCLIGTEKSMGALRYYLDLLEDEPDMGQNWEWLIGRKVSLGEVIDVCGDTATVRRGDDETRILITELLHEDFKATDRVAQSMSEALNTGDGAYRP